MRQVTLTLAVLFFGFTLGAQDLSIVETDGNTIFEEGCSYTLHFELEFPSPGNIDYVVSLLGVSQEDVDYTLDIPNSDTISFSTGDVELTYTLDVINELALDDNESFNIHYERLVGQDDEGTVFFTIVENRPLKLSQDGDITLCHGDEIRVIEASGSGVYHWETDDFDILEGEDSSAVIFRVENNGSIRVFARSGSCLDTAEINFEYFGDEEFGYIEDSLVYICKGDETTVNSIISENADISWSPNQWISSTTSPDPVFSPEVTTTYYLSVTTEHCSYFDSVIVQVDSLPETDLVAIPPTEDGCEKYCPGDVIKLTSTDIIKGELYPDIVYEWNPKDGLEDGIDTLESAILIASSGDRTYYRKNINNACESLDSIEIKVVDTNIPISDDTTVCYNVPVDITIDDTDLTDISWEPERDLSCTDCPNPTATATMTTTYKMTATKEDCCPVEATITITVEIPPIPLQPIGVCPNIDFIYDPDLGPGFSDYTWKGDTEFLSCTDCATPTINVPDGTYNFTLQAYNGEGCLSVGDLIVNTYNPPQVTMTADPGTEVAAGSEVGVTVSFNPDFDLTEYYWTYNGNEIPGTETGTTAQILEEGDDNWIVLHYVDQFGCQREWGIQITGIFPMVEIPSAFTPDGDGTNDFFRPIISNAEHIPGFVQEFLVSNRFGTIIYEHIPDTEGWNGNIKNDNDRPAPPEVYFYMIKLLYPNGEEEVRKGDVTLIR